jgi:hypothetical protein
VQLLGRDESGGLAKGVLYRLLLRGIALGWHRGWGSTHERTFSTIRQIT